MSDRQVTVKAVFTPIVTEVRQPSQTTTVLAIAQGPAGPPGPVGPPNGSDKHYRHDQMTATALWVVNHNLDKHPAVSVVDSAGTEVEGSIQHMSDNVTHLRFSAAFSGTAYCN